MNVVRRVVAIVLLVVAMAGAATARVVWSGEREIAKSSEALRKGDANDAIVHARAAALWYAPAAPHVRVAYGRLMALAKEAERRKLWDTAHFAYGAVVNASTATRWIGRPHAADAEEATRALARIDARVSARPPATANEPVETIEQSQLAALSEDVGPSRAYTAVLAASFVALLAGLGAFLRFGLDETGRVRLSRALPAAAAVLVGLAGYCVALFFA